MVLFKPTLIWTLPETLGIMGTLTVEEGILSSCPSNVVHMHVIQYMQMDEIILA